MDLSARRERQERSIRELGTDIQNDDLPLPEARKIHAGFIVNGGMTAHDTEVFDDARAKIRDNVRSLFREMRPLDRFIYSSACNASIRTPWENLLAFWEACWEFGTTGG